MQYLERDEHNDNEREYVLYIYIYLWHGTYDENDTPMKRPTKYAEVEKAALPGGLATLVFGPLSDHIGRRKVLLFLELLLTLSTLCCASASPQWTAKVVFDFCVRGRSLPSWSRWKWWEKKMLREEALRYWSILEIPRCTFLWSLHTGTNIARNWIIITGNYIGNSARLLWKGRGAAEGAEQQRDVGKQHGHESSSSITFKGHNGVLQGAILFSFESLSWVGACVC